jgi:ACS family sodium-dependent inorganic phosphate cotransporter-like MFS transporter 5
MATPWGKILTSLPVIAIFVAQTSNAWGLYTLLTELPTYMRTVLHFDIKEVSQNPGRSPSRTPVRE